MRSAQEPNLESQILTLEVIINTDLVYPRKTGVREQFPLI